VGQTHRQPGIVDEDINVTPSGGKVQKMLICLSLAADIKDKRQDLNTIPPGKFFGQLFEPLFPTACNYKPEVAPVISTVFLIGISVSVR